MGGKGGEKRSGHVTTALQLQSRDDVVGWVGRCCCGGPG